MAATSLISAADSEIRIAPDHPAVLQLTLSAAELREKPTVYLSVNPNLVEIVVTAPDGKRFAGSSRDDKQPLAVTFADKKSSSQDEIWLAEMLEGDAILVRWDERALAGTYKIEVSGKNLTSAISVKTRQRTAEALERGIQDANLAMQKQVMDAMLPGPEKRAPINAKGTARLAMEGDWQNDDIIFIGPTLIGSWSATVTLPDGTAVTEATAKSLGCTWQTSAWPTTGLFQPKDGASQVSLGCPARIRKGSIVVEFKTTAPGAAGSELAAAVMRPSAIAALLASDDGPRGQNTVALIHKSSVGEQQGFASVAAGASAPIRLELRANGNLIQEAEVTAITYLIDESKAPSISIIGPHPSKKPAGPPIKVPRSGNDEFVFRLPGQRLGKVQVDFEAIGTFQNGRRFSASADVQVFVHELAARVTSIRQQRIGVAGKPALAQFAIELEVIMPGLFEGTVNTSKAQGPLVWQDLRPGRQTIVVNADERFTKALIADPSAPLNLNIGYGGPRKGKFTPLVAIETTIPKAGEFQGAKAVRSGLAASGEWRLDNSGLTVTQTLGPQSKGCKWSAVLELEPQELRRGEVIRPAGSTVEGTVSTKDGRFVAESHWALAPFFSGPQPLPNQQAFVVRITNAAGGCPGSQGYLGPVQEMRFIADLTGLRPVASSGGGFLVELLDRDHDGKFDHLKASFDLLSPSGGTCIWMGTLQTKMRTSGQSQRAETKPGMNKVSMELEVEGYNFWLAGETSFQMSVTNLKCGANPELSKKEIENENAPRYLMQRLTIDGKRFAGEKVVQ